MTVTVTAAHFDVARDSAAAFADTMAERGRKCIRMRSTRRDDGTREIEMEFSE